MWLLSKDTYDYDIKWNRINRSMGYLFKRYKKQMEE